MPLITLNGEELWILQLLNWKRRIQIYQNKINVLIKENDDLQDRFDSLDAYFQWTDEPVVEENYKENAELKA